MSQLVFDKGQCFCQTGLCLWWLFLQFDGTVPFTDLVDQAWQQGLTEPDPRVDLSGKDVMRKLVILAREAGYDIEPDQVRVAMNKKQQPSAKKLYGKSCRRSIPWQHRRSTTTMSGK